MSQNTNFSLLWSQHMVSTINLHHKSASKYFHKNSSSEYCIHVDLTLNTIGLWIQYLQIHIVNISFTIHITINIIRQYISIGSLLNFSQVPGLYIIYLHWKSQFYERSLIHKIIIVLFQYGGLALVNKIYNFFVILHPMH